MNVASFGESTCEKIRRYLDSYISNELLVETNLEVLRHLETCASCSAEFEARTRLKSRLKGAVEGQSLPEDLAGKIREQIRRHEARPMFAAWTVWMAAAAAVILVWAGIQVARTRTAMPDLADRLGQDVFIQKVSETVSAVLRVGLGDHVHCSVFRKYPKNPPSLDQLAESMGPTYRGLVPVVRAAVPEEYRMIMAHQCSYGERRFVHLTLSNGTNLLSLVIARKRPGESLQALPPAVRTGAVPLYQAAAERYEVAGFETDDYLAFVVSDLGGKTNLLLASNLAPAVAGFLSKVRG
jgi:hypothetical protein